MVTEAVTSDLQHMQQLRTALTPLHLHSLPNSLLLSVQTAKLPSEGSSLTHVESLLHAGLCE